jgi:hypothetical protein
MNITVKIDILDLIYILYQLGLYVLFHISQL